MKKKVWSSVLFSFIFCLLSSQVPQGFNYQAVARTTAGEPLVNLTNLQVMLYIQSSPTGGTIFWKELHNPVTTNAFGAFTVVLGNGVPQAGRTVTAFNLIDWSVTPKYVKTEIYYSGAWKDMGNGTQLWSVPYSLTARDLGGSVKKIAVKGETSLFDEALFEVKNKNDQTVFAVYNEGVRVYVDDGAKGKRGGFAVGGFGTDKASSQRYMYIAGDSIRMYIDDLPGKGSRGGFAVGGFDQSKGISADFLNVATDEKGILNPSENRILWYPLKNAFLSGRVLIESPDSVGLNSFASGFESKAKGDYSQALGFSTAARGDYSTAIGNKSTANGLNSFAFGHDAIATKDDSYAIGTGARATGLKSFALGSSRINDTTGILEHTVASGQFAFALGFASVASGPGAFAMGIFDSASAIGSLSMGYWNRSRANFSTTFGAGNIVEKAGDFGLAAGLWTKAGNWAASAFGSLTYASGHTSFATGFMTTASGQLSSTFGDQTISQSYGSMAIGRYNVTSGNSTSWVTTDPVFAVGNGTSPTARSNALTLYKNGNLTHSGNLNTGGNSNTNGTITSDGTYMRLSNNPGTGTSPAYYWYQGSSGSTSKQFAFAINDALWVTGPSVFESNLNLDVSGSAALSVAGSEAIWYNGTYYSWGYGGTYNYFADKVTIGNPASSAYALYVQGNSYSSGVWAGSDARWKKDLERITNTLPLVLRLQGYSYNWRDKEYPDMKFEKERQVGLIAQDVEKIYPELVRTDENGYKAVSYEKLTVILLESIKEQQKQIDEQKERIEKLEELIKEKGNR